MKPGRIIALVGLMGCGKSAIGKRLARKLNISFIDLDSAITEKAGKSITEIFAQSGEGHFRELEKQTLEEIVASGPCVLATGGGAFINEYIRGILKSKAICVWIKADFAILLERVARKNTRPLLEKGDKAKILKSLMDERYPIYEQAHISVESTDGPHELVVNRILKELENAEFENTQS